MILMGSNSVESMAQLFTTILIFVFVVALTWFATRYIASFQKQKLDMTNIEVLETAKIAPNKYLQIIRSGEKYILIAVCKDTVTMLTELDKDSLVMKQKDATQTMDFKSILDKAKVIVGNRNDKKKVDRDE